MLPRKCLSDFTHPLPGSLMLQYHRWHSNTSHSTNFVTPKTSCVDHKIRHCSFFLTSKKTHKNPRWKKKQLFNDSKIPPPLAVRVMTSHWWFGSSLRPPRWLFFFQILHKGNLRVVVTSYPFFLGDFQPTHNRATEASEFKDANFQSVRL